MTLRRLAVISAVALLGVSGGCHSVSNHDFRRGFVSLPNTMFYSPCAEVVRRMPEPAEPPADTPPADAEDAQLDGDVYYVLTEGKNLGDHIVQVRLSEDETVLDAISHIDASAQIPIQSVRIERPCPAGAGAHQLLDVDLKAVLKGRDTTTNYRLQPGDRVIVVEGGVAAFFDDLGNRAVNSFDRLLSTQCMGGQTISHDLL